MSRRKRRALNKLALLQLYCEHPDWKTKTFRYYQVDVCVVCKQEDDKTRTTQFVIYTTKRDLKLTRRIYFMAGVCGGWLLYKFMDWWLF